MKLVSHNVTQLKGFDRRSVVSLSAKTPSPNTKNTGLADGWGVELPKAAGTASKAQPANTTELQDGWGVKPTKTAGVEQPTKQATKKPGHKQAPGDANQKQNKSASVVRTPYMDIKSEQGILGLTLLQQKLAREGKISNEDRLAIRANAQDAIQAKKQQKGAGGMQLAVPSKPPGKRVIVYEDDNGETWEEEEDEDISDKPTFALTFNEDGTEYTEYDKQGNVLVRRGGAASHGADDGWDALQGDDEDQEDEEFDELDFSDDNSGWRQLSSASAGTSAGALPQMEEQKLVPVSKKRGKPSQQQPDADQDLMVGSQGGGRASLVQVEEEDWGLEEFGGPGAGGRKTLMEELGVVKRRGKKGGKDPEPELDVTVAWGGSGASTGMVDLEEQEALLSRMFKPHRVKELMAHQRAAVEEGKRLRKASAPESKTHSQLRIVGGSAANRKLLSSAGAQTRPMMEKVRQAIFNMIQSQAGSISSLPKGARWLDLFAGTGSVGLEALSRGAGECHFVEMDPWVTKNILGRNISTCGFQRQAIVHTFKAEEFLRKALELPRFAGGAFDFISMCPPYLLVSYPELFSLLEKSPLLHPGSILFVEYPKQLSHEVPDTVGPLVKVRDRKYGRTWIVVYAPPEALSDDE